MSTESKAAPTDRSLGAAERTQGPTERKRKVTDRISGEGKPGRSRCTKTQEKLICCRSISKQM